jgi:hypothetical protein
MPRCVIMSCDILLQDMVTEGICLASDEALGRLEGVVVGVQRVLSSAREHRMYQDADAAAAQAAKVCCNGAS